MCGSPAKSTKILKKTQHTVTFDVMDLLFSAYSPFFSFIASSSADKTTPQHLTC